jgi:plasmid stabilization system protein ParE
LFSSPLADDKYFEILTYLDKAAGHAVALRYEADFTRLLTRLSEHPESGNSLGNKRPVRRAIVPPYNFYYRYDRRTDTVLILRILDGRR